jgi:8-oxo-dGTP pyrophosphatase MutT (NUDIX family)
MPKERFKLVPASYLVLIKDSKILLLRRYKTGYEDGNYSLIAGHLDGDETFIQAIVREAKEEAGIDIKPEDLEVVHVMHRKKQTDSERIDIFIQANSWEGEPENLEPEKCDDLSWFDMDSLPKNIIPCIKQAIECIRERRVYSEFGW